MMSSIDFNKIEKGAFVKESIDILHQAYMSKKLVLFVGAGVDRNSDMPLWDDAKKEFCKHMNIRPEDVDNLKVPQFYFNSRGKKEYVELSREIFHYGREMPINDLHRKVVDFNVNTIITTNYTDFLAQEMSNRGHIYATVSQDKDLPYIKNEKLIIKMHGDFQHDNFVLKEDDYLSYSYNFRLIETYIKAIIAKNIVLFIGYSFNDPDMKQLFSWVKDVLGNDFQHAYMLEGFRNYDENEFEYYKNLGVNVIYTNTFDEDNQKALIEVMDLIKVGYGENLSDVEEAARYFRPYLNINYILGKYLKAGLGKCNLLVEADVVGCRPNKRNTNELLLRLTEKVNEKNLDPNDAYGVIANILQKSGIDRISVLKEKGYEYINIPHTENKIIDLIMTFDYVELRVAANRNGFFKYDDALLYLQQAYIYYVLEEYSKAYSALCEAAERAFNKREFYTYYIAQFNKVKIKGFIEYDANTLKEIRDKIREEIECINLNNIIMDMPDLSSDDNQMLKDISSFQLQYSLFQDAYRISEKVKKQQNTIYSFFAGVPDYINLQWMIKDYFRYLVCNCIMIDNYREVQEVFILYVRSILASAVTPDKKDYFEEEQIGNIHAPNIGTFELFLIIKYMSEKEIKNMFEQCGIDTIPLEENCSDFIKIVLGNLRREKGLRCNRELWNCLMVVSYMDIDCGLAEDLVDCISERLNWLVCREHKGIIYRILKVGHEKKNFKKRQEEVFKICDYAVGRFLQNLVKLAEFADESSLHDYGDIISNVCFVFYSMYNEKYDENLSGLLKNETSLVIAKMYPYCSERNQRIIKEYLIEQFKENSLNMHELYYEMVINDIIEPAEDYESLIFAKIDKIKEDSRGYSPNPYEAILNEMCNLYINNKVKYVDRFKDAVMNSDDFRLVFLGDIENFDYSKFDIEWLKQFRGGLLKEIAQNEVARVNISRKFAERMECGEIGSQLLKLYFKYFIE